MVRLSMKRANVSPACVQINDMKYVLHGMLKQLDKVPIINEGEDNSIQLVKDIVKSNIVKDMYHFQELFTQCFGKEFEA